jgi:hypothetical protein
MTYEDFYKIGTGLWVYPDENDGISKSSNWTLPLHLSPSYNTHINIIV